MIGAPDPPAGTPRWYAWLFTPPSARATLAHLFQLENELRSIVIAPRDHGVAHLKLQWWREEIGRLAAGTPRHPLTQALAQTAPDAVAAWPPLGDFLTSLELELAAVAIDDDAELGRFLALADGHTRSIALALESGNQAARADLGADVGQAIRGVQIVTAWCATAMDQTRREAVKRLAARSRSCWESALTKFASSGFASLRGLRVLGALSMLQLTRLEHASFRPGLRRELPAMRSLWTAWRAARQHGHS